jgi:hypothetical protein
LHPSPLYLGEEAELVFTGPLYDYLVKFNLERYTINRPKAKQQSILQAIRKEYQKLIPESKPNINWRSQWEPTKGAIFEGKGDMGCPRASLPSPL